MDDLVTWLCQQLDDEQRDSERVHYSLCSSVALRGPGHPCDCGFPDQRRVEVDAKRRILDLHGLIWRDIGWLETDEDGSRDEAYAELEVCGYCVRKHSSFATRADVPTGPCLTVRLLATPYADRPGYREEWKP